MKFSISIRIDQKANHKSDIIVNMSQELKVFFADRFYGEDVQDYIIGCLCTSAPEGFEKFNKTQKPVYVDDKTTKNKFTGEPHRMFKLFINEFNFNNEEYDDFVDSSDEESKKILAKKILECLENLDKLPKKVKDFDKERFKEDMQHVFKGQGLI